MKEQKQWTTDKVIDFINWYLKVCKIDSRHELENQSLIDSFLNGDAPELWHQKYFGGQEKLQTAEIRERISNAFDENSTDAKEIRERISNAFDENSTDANNGQMSVVTEDSYSDLIDEIFEEYAAQKQYRDPSPDLSPDEIANEGIKYLQEKYPDKKILQLPDVSEGGEFLDFAMGLQIGYTLSTQKHIPTAEYQQEKITNAFYETRSEDVKNNLEYRDRDYFQAGYDFAMSSHIPADYYPKEFYLWHIEDADNFFPHRNEKDELVFWDMSQDEGITFDELFTYWKEQVK